MSHALALLLGYLLGSIPFGLILTRLAGGGDVRAIGSGNIGATNVLRTGRKGLAAATLLGDMLKGTAAVLIAASLWGADEARSAGLAAFLGHLFPVWLGFKGGKGVATFIGVLIAMSPLAAVGYAVVWGLVAAITRYSSLAALIACAMTPVMLWMLGLRAEAGLFLLLAALVWFTHRANIERLRNGTENRIGAKSGSAPTA
jgi:glycerol-3-phosphate acyltransferase PlsY